MHSKQDSQRHQAQQLLLASAGSIGTDQVNVFKPMLFLALSPAKEILDTRRCVTYLSDWNTLDVL